MKKPVLPSPIVRQPRQERARLKVALILEAAIRLLEKGGPDQLTTNAVAQTAGVSIGTLYQYFPNKRAILDALVEREMDGIAQRVTDILQDDDPADPRERIGRIIRAITQSYGESRRVHRVVIQHSLSTGTRRMGAVIRMIAARLAAPDHPAHGVELNEWEAFVLTTAFGGVMREAILREDLSTADHAAIEQALADLMVRFVQGRAPPRYAENTAIA